MAHAAASRTENVLKQGYLKRSPSSPDFLMSASKQLALNLKQKLEPNRWYVFGTRNGNPYLEYFDREERVFSGHPIDTIDLSTFRNLSYTLGRTNNKHTFCIFLSNRVLELTAPNRPQMLDWCRCLERNLRQLGFRNQLQREDHQYSEFPVNNYKPKRSASPTDDQHLARKQNLGQSGSEAAENDYEDVSNSTSVGMADASAGAPRLPPRPPKPHVEQEEEVFASLDSVMRTSNASSGVYYMFDYSEEDQRLMQAYVSASEDQNEPEVDNSDLALYDDADVLTACHSLEERKADHSDNDDDIDEEGERCTSLPIIPPRASESDTSEDPDFVSASFWLRNKRDYQNLKSLRDSSNVSIKDPRSRELPPIPKSVDDAPPVPRRAGSARDIRSRHCFSLYAQHKPVAAKEAANNFKIDCVPPPLPKRLDLVEIKRLEEKDKHDFKTEHSQKEIDSKNKEMDIKVNLGKRFDSLHVCLNPFENKEEKDAAIYETVKSPGKELNNNCVHLKANNAIENSIYGQVWDDERPGTNVPKSEEDMPSKSACSEKLLSKDDVSLKSTVALPVSDTAESSDNHLHENFYSDFPLKAESKNSGACGFDSEFSMRNPDSDPSSVTTGLTSPVLPKRKFPPKSHSSSDLQEMYSEVNNYPTLPVGQTEPDSVFDNSHNVPVAPPRRSRKTVAGHRNEVNKQRDGKSDQEVKSSLSITDLHSPPLPVRSHNMSGRKMSEDGIDIPLPLPPRKGTVRTQSINDANSIVCRPRSHISVRQKSVPQSGVVTVMNLKQNQVDILRSEIATIGGMVRTIATEHFKSGLALVECFDKIWIAGWDVKKYPRLYDKFHIGDQLLSVNDVQITDITFANKIIKHIKADFIELTIRRLPNASAFAIQRSMEGENIGIKREGGTGEIIYIDPHGLAYQHGLRNKATSMDGNSVCNWYLTEINNRPLNLFFKDIQIEHRLLAVGKDISIVVQPCDFIQELKKQLKKLRGYKDFLVQ